MLILVPTTHIPPVRARARRSARCLAWISTLLLSGTAAANPTGYRGDVSGVYEAATSPPLVPPDTTVSWRHATDTWSNAQPVLWDDLVCITLEPTLLRCLDRRDGTQVWEADNDVVETKQGEERAAHIQLLEQAAAAQEKLAQTRIDYAKLRREVRRDPSLAPKLGEYTAELSRLMAILDTAAPYLTPPDKEIIGYASATPTVDGDAIYALFGQGVLSRFSKSGTRVWSVWLGPHAGQMNGYHMGSTASPLLVDNTLVVPYGELRGLDPADGTIRWTAGPYIDYGTPAILRLDGVAYLALPDGRIVRVSDGKTLLEGLGAPWYTGPLVVGDVVYYVGAKGPQHIREEGHVPARAHRISASPEGLSHELLWESRLPGEAPFYAPPVFARDRLHVVDRDATLWVLDSSDGTFISRALRGDHHSIGQVYAPLTLVADSLYLSGEGGAAFRLHLDDPTVLAGEAMLGSSRGAPIADASGTLYLRTLEELLCIAP